MTSYNETPMTKKFQVEVAINYKDMGGQSSLSHLLTSFKARILCQLANLKCLTLRFFLSMISTVFYTGLGTRSLVPQYVACP